MRHYICKLVVCLQVVACAMWAQEFRATISGHVLDASGGAVPKAKVQATNLSTNETNIATTDSSGTYTIPLLRPGDYNVTVTAAGFKQYNRERLTLQVGQIAGLEISLEVGAVTESINVTGEAALLETQTASRSGIVNTQQVSELPLNARNPFMLGTMMPGVTFRGAAIWQRPFDNGAIAEWSVNGGRQSNNEFMMDGAPNNGQAGNNNIAYVPIVDAVQEFNVQMNSYDAQYGHTGGGVFNVVLKSGGNDFHATGWEFLRRKWLDANTFQGNAVGAKRADHLLDQYGFQLEGPVYIPKLLTKQSKTKLFYLGSFENYRENTPNPLTNSYPEQEMRNGDFSKLKNAAGNPITIYDPLNYTLDANSNPIRTPFAGNIIPADRINPVAKAVTGYMPLPNTATRAGFAYSTNNHLLPNYVNHDKFYNLILKFDFNFGDKNRAFFRHASNDRTEDRAVNGLDNVPGTDGQQPFQRINDAYVADWVSTLTPTLILNVRGSYSRFIETGRGQANSAFDITKLGVPSSLVSQLPGPYYFGRWQMDGYSALGRGQGINITNNYNLAVNVTKIAGSHTLKAGIDIRRIHYIQQNSGDIFKVDSRRDWTQQVWNQGDAVSGDSYASFLLGLPNTNGTTDRSSLNYPLYPFNRQWYVSPYVQDDWKISRRLTLNLGLRWDFNQAPDEKWNRMNRGFDSKVASPLRSMFPAETLAQYPSLANLSGGFSFAGVGGQPTIASKNVWTNWQPRIGAAYQLNDRLVMRGGYGLYFLNPNNNYLQNAGFSAFTPLVNSNDGGRTPIPNVLSNPYPSGITRPSGSSLGALTFVGRNNNWFDPTFTTPKVHQFSFGFQQQVSQTATLELTYVGSRTIGANGEKDYNIPSLAFRKTCNLMEGGSPIYCNEQLPNPFKGLAPFLGTNYYTANTISRYNLARPFPQFDGTLLQQGRNDSNIWYNSLQVTYNQRVGRDLIINTNYTFSKMVERWGYTDPFADQMQQGLYLNDRPHWFKFTAVYELPFGQGKHFGAGTTGFVKKLISGWQATTFYNNASGEPAELRENVIQLKDPRTPGGGWDGNVDWKANKVRGWNPCVLRQQDNGTIAPQPYSLNLGCGTDHSNYAWLQVANFAPARYAPYRSGQVRKHHAFTLDASISKMTNITERFRVQFRAEAFNLFNHNYFGRTTFTTDPNDANFGTMFPSTATNQNSFPRQIQLGIKAFW
ncbi:TonB-dependent receptor domain-containing protein [uncultured Paludibaculum sp.]|uniref:TonB-dependent receptor domain-containing protein n=1 Tax=uncultured Paludibaculum sp. TaxID=1765020 RepID=UPI002AAA6930|nr:TonB-dependent receptor [uncultured Paludibaculum sp.]